MFCNNAKTNIINVFGYFDSFNIGILLDKMLKGI